MAIPHAASGELIDVRPLGENLRQTSSSTLVRADHLEVFRLVLAAGKAAPDHKASGAITIQCLEGAVDDAITAEADPLFGGEIGQRYQQLHRQILIAAE